MDKTEKILTQIKNVLDTNLNANYESYGKLNIHKRQVRDSKGKTRTSVIVESGGYDWNYAGNIEIEASPTGKVLNVFVRPVEEGGTINVYNMEGEKAWK